MGGVNHHGQPSDGMNTDRSVPSQEDTNATDWSSVSAGYYQSRLTFFTSFKNKTN